MAHVPRFALFVLLLGFSAFSLGPVPAQAVTLQVNGSGILTGATGVDVGGTLYDIEFVDGTCVALFTGCDASTDFTFQTLASAQTASQALLGQVFTGSFDTAPTLTAGCTSSAIACVSITPYEFDTTFSTYSVQMAQNSSIESGDLVAGFGGGSPLDTSTLAFATYARWQPQPITAVPEPSSAALLISGLLGLAGYEWRRRVRTLIR